MRQCCFGRSLRGLLLATLVAGCGQKGPLYLPTTPPPTSTPASSPPPTSTPASVPSPTSAPASASGR